MQTLSTPTTQKKCPWKRKLCSWNGLRRSRKKHRYRSGFVALREIRQHQKSTWLLIKRNEFKSVTEPIFLKYGSDKDVSPIAYEALQHAAEAFVTQLFKDTNSITLHSKRQTIKTQDLVLATELTTPKFVINKINR
eukprot:138345_1